MKWVLAQSTLIWALVVSLLRPVGPHLAWVGFPLVALGGAAAIWAAITLGSAFTPLPTPRGPVVVNGPYRFVRHPIYTALVVLFVGLSLAYSWIGLAPTAALAVLWFFKARVEEGRLAERFPDYVEYRRRTRF